MSQSFNFQVINGPNLNMLGKREPEIYGSKTLEDISRETNEFVKPLNIKLDWFQSNIEGEIVNKIQSLHGSACQGLIINPGAYSHTSVAILDALKILSIPIVEVHLSNTHLREEFRAVKLTAKSSTIIMEGLGQDCYCVASFALARRLKS
jgi:3-dehydroquinate dehydratase-2